MTKRKLTALSEDEIVDLFATLCVEQDRAMDREEQGKVNRLFFEIVALEKELQARSGDRRRALLRLYDHSNMQVRLEAGLATLAVDYPAARRQLEAIVQSEWYPQAGAAGMTIETLDSGFYKPT